MEEYAIVFVAIFAVNLMPAFGPPTWSVLVLFSLNLDLDPWILVPLGASAAALGRFALASASGWLRPRFSEQRIASLDAARATVTANRRRSAVGLGLFALSPVPSAQLFVAAGLLGVALVPLTLAFFSGRLVSYAIYVGAANAVAETSFGNLLRDSLTSPTGIVLQLGGLAALVLLVKVDWVSRLGKSSAITTECGQRTPTDAATRDRG